MDEAFCTGRVKHCFQPLCGAVQQQKQDENTCVFQPLLSGSATHQRLSKPIGVDEDSRTLQEKLDKAFNGGCAAGKAEASRIVKASLGPELQGFARCIQDFSEFTKKTTADCAKQTVRLAIAVAGHILGAEPSLSADDLSELQTELDAAFHAASRLIVKMHPRDRSALEQLIASDTAQLPLPLPMDIQTDDAIPSGCLHLLESDDRRREMEKIISRKIAEVFDPSPSR